MKLNNICLDLKELTHQDSVDINGGETMWYWIAYAASASIHATVDYISSVREANAGLVGIK